MKNLLLVLLLFCNVAYSQSFKPVTTNSKINLFSNDSPGYVQGFRVDSVINSGNFEIINFHYQLRRELNKVCVNPFSASWMGEKCVKDTSNQIAYFFNENKDTLVIQYSKSLGESWNFFKKNKTLIKAKVIGINIEKLSNGKTEMVKSIQLFNDSLGIDLWNKYKPTLKISQNYGFVQLIDFFTMPNIFSKGDNNPSMEKYQFKSIPYRIIKLSDIYNYNEGDLFEYHRIDNFGPDDLHLMEIIKKYSSTKYLIKNTVQNNMYKEPNLYSEITITYDTFRIDYDDTLLDAKKLLPGETFGGLSAQVMSQVFSYGCQYADSVYYFPRETFSKAFFKKDFDTCWNTFYENYDYSNYRAYKEGYGHDILYKLNNFDHMEKYEYMIYSKKGNKTTGTFVPLGVDELNTKGKFSIYPNPSSNTVYFNSGNLKMEGYKVCSINGQTLIEATEYENEGIDISDLAIGLYFITIHSAEGNSTIRFLKTENK